MKVEIRENGKKSYSIELPTSYKKEVIKKLESMQNKILEYPKLKKIEIKRMKISEPTIRQRNALKKMGYSWEEINRFNMYDASKRIGGEIDKEI